MTDNILLCDDEIHILRAAEYKLRKLGCEVRLAFDGEEAWSCIQQRVPRLLVSDYQMPRLNGLELIARIRSTPALDTLPIILLTAKGLELERERLIEQFRLTTILSKPFSPRELSLIVQRVLLASEALPESSSARHVCESS